MPFSLCSSVTKLSESPGCTAPFHQSHGGRKLDKGNAYFTYGAQVGRRLKRLHRKIVTVLKTVIEWSLKRIRDQNSLSLPCNWLK